MAQRIKLRDTNIIDYSTMTEGTGDISGFGDWMINGANPTTYISRIYGTGPHGDTALMWDIIGTGTTQFGISNVTGYTSGGQLSDTAGYMTFDNTKTYRYSIWVNRVSSGDTAASSGERFYFGCYLMKSDNTNTGGTYLTTGAYSTNIYFAQSTAVLTTYFPYNQWRLLTGFIFPHSWTGTTNHPDSGCWKPDGTNLGVIYGNDVKAHPNASKTYWRIYSPYVGGRYCNYRLIYPRFDCIDGTEPSITTLLNNEGPWRNVTSMKINLDTNLIDYDEWRTDLVGNTAHFKSYNVEAENYRKLDTNPWGVSDYVWANSGITAGNLNYGGWNQTTTWDVVYPVDHTKSYRVSVWVKRKVKSTAGLMYFGLWTVAGPYGFGNFTNSIRTTDGHIGTNHYFVSLPFSSLDTYLPQDVWKLLVAYVRPSTWTGTTLTADAGFYTQAGVLQSNMYEYKFSGTTAYMCSRCIIDSADINAVQYTLYPRIDCVDGTEPSIATLLAGEGPWRNVVGGWVNIGDTWKRFIGSDPLLGSVLVVGGGSGGGNATYEYSGSNSYYYGGNGGGAGGVMYSTGFTLTTGSVVVGGGGASTANGNDSSYSTITANKGLASGVSGNGRTAGSSDFCGAGGSYWQAKGGGGGSTSNGGNAIAGGLCNQATTGNGGGGTTNTITGSSVVYAGGGRGGKAQPNNTAGSTVSTIGKGGNGADKTNDTGTQSGAAGGSGIVIIRYTSATQRATGGTVTQSGGDWIHTFTASGTFTLT